MALEPRLLVGLAEGARVEVRVAGIASRAIAAAIDLGIATFVIFALAGAGSASDWWLGSWRPLGALAGIVGFPMAMELLSGGWTVGKRAMGLRVVSADGGLLTSRALIVRNSLRVVDMLPFPYGIGLVSAVWSSKGQRVGDMAAGTAVVLLPSVDRAALQPPSTALLQWAASSSPGGTVDPAIWDTGGLTADDMRAVRRFLDRRASMPTPMRMWAANELAARITPKLVGAPAGLPPEAVLEGVVLGGSRR